MSNIVTGAMAALLALGFFLYYAIRLEELVLWLIIGVNVILMIYDYYQSIREGEEHI